MDKQTIFGQNKILNHPEKVAEWLQGGSRSLITFELDMTNKCNNNCPKCSGWHKIAKTEVELTLEEAKNYIGQLKDFGAKGVIFSGGGEPLIHKDTVNAVCYADDLGLDVGLITNGLALDLGRINMEVLLNSCKWIRVSLDAGNPGMYIKTHGMGVGAFIQVVKNIKQLVKMRNKIGAECTIGTGYITGEGTDSFEEMMLYASISASTEVDYAQFRPFHNNFSPIKKQFKEIQERFEKSLSKTKIVCSEQKYMRFGDKDKRPYRACYGVNFVTIICADSNVYICCHHNGNQKYSLGSLKEKSFKDIWADRQKVFNKIQFKDCPALCRCDEFNRLLWEIKQEKTHINFL